MKILVYCIYGKIDVDWYSSVIYCFYFDDDNINDDIIDDVPINNLDFKCKENM